MNDDTTTVDLLQIKIEEAKRDLPIDTVNAIAAVDWKAAILGMRNKYGYTFEQLGDLEIETELLLCGLLPPEDYPKELSGRMGIPRTQADELVKDMNELVFKKIREELIKNTERKRIFSEREAEKEKVVVKIPVKSIREALPIPENIVKTPEPIKIPIRPAPVPVIVKVVSERPTSQNSPLEKYPLGGGGLNSSTPTQASPLNEGNKPIDIGKPVTPPPFIVEKVKAVEPILTQKLSGAFQIPKVETNHSLDNISKPAVTPYAKNKDPYRLSPDE